MKHSFSEALPQEVVGMPESSDGGSPLDHDVLEMTNFPSTRHGEIHHLSSVCQENLLEIGM